MSNRRFSNAGHGNRSIVMSLLSPDRRVPKSRAVRLILTAALLVAAASAAWVGMRPRSRGPANNNPGSRGVPTALGPAIAAGDRGAVPGASGRGEAGSDQDAGPGVAERAPGTGWGSTASRSSGRPRETVSRDAAPVPAGQHGRAWDSTGAEELLAAWSHLERQIDVALARARESVVSLEYTSVHPRVGARRIASGVVISHHGDVLSVQIDPPPGGAVSNPAASGGKDQTDAGASIVARDYLGHRHAAQWLAADPHTGLTLLRLAPRVVRPIRAMTDTPKLGSQVFVVGNPFGMGHSVSRGHVAGLDRAVLLGRRQLGGLIQIQAPIYPGDSGAMVVDIRGAWLGLIRSGLGVPGASGSPAADGAAAPGSSPSARTTGQANADNQPGDAGDDRPTELETDFGFAIPSRDALWIAEQLRTRGRVDRAYLGVRFERAPVFAGPTVGHAADSNPSPSTVVAQAPAGGGAWRGPGGAPISSSPEPETTTPTETTMPDRDEALLLDDGARIGEVLPDTPAAKAGLRPGDRIVVLDGQPIRSRMDAVDRLNRTPAQATVTLGVYRPGDPIRPRFEVSVRTSSRPSPELAPAQAPASAPAASPESHGAHAGTPSSTDPVAVQTEPAPPAGDTRRDPAPADAPPVPRRNDASNAPVQQPTAPATSSASALAVPDRTSAANPPALNEIKHTLPRAVVEHIEHLERRIVELEHQQDPRGPAGREPTGRTGAEQARASGARRP